MAGVRWPLAELGAMSPAMPLDGYGSVVYVAWEGNCPKAEDSGGVARWALGMLRTKSPEEAAATEYSLKLENIIERDVGLVPLILCMLKVRCLRHYSPSTSQALCEYAAQEVEASCQYTPAVHMLLSVLATESSCRFETWPVPPRGKAARDCAALAPTAANSPSRRENDTALGKLLDANAYVEHVRSNRRCEAHSERFHPAGTCLSAAVSFGCAGQRCILVSTKRWWSNCSTRAPSSTGSTARTSRHCA